MKDFLVRFIDNVFFSNIVCSLGDLLLHGDTLDNGQLTVMSRYYDILRFESGEDSTFPFQNALSYVMWGDKHDMVTGNKNFLDLIYSYRENGYKQGSRIVLYKDIIISNGTHRVALNFFHGIFSIDAKVLFRTSRNKRGISWYIERGLDKEWEIILQETKKKVEDILFTEGEALMMVFENLSPDNYRDLEGLLKSSCKSYRIIKKGNGCIVEYSLIDPDYKLKKKTLYSLSVDRIILRIRKTLNLSIVAYSHNCQEGRDIFRRFNI